MTLDYDMEDAVDDDDKKLVTTTTLDVLRTAVFLPLLPIRVAGLALSEAHYMAAFAAHNLQNLVETLVAYAHTGAARETWDFTFHILMKLMRGMLRFRGHALWKARAGTRFTITPMSRTVRILPFKFHVSRTQLLEPEREAAGLRPEGVYGYTIPEELDAKDRSKDSMTIDGEWVEYTGQHGADGRPTGKPMPDATGKEYERIMAQYRASCAASGRRQKVILYLHGGAYMFLSAKSHRFLTNRIAQETGARLFVVNYRLAPEHPMPAALHDAFAAYRFLINPHDPIFNNPSSFFTANFPIHKPINPRDIIVMGDSAGGGLSTALTVYLKDYLRNADGAPMYPLPGGLALISPWVDLTCSSESFKANESTDYLPSKDGSVFEMMYTDGPNPVFAYVIGSKRVHRTFVPGHTAFMATPTEEQRPASPERSSGKRTPSPTSFNPAAWLGRKDSAVSEIGRPVAPTDRPTTWVDDEEEMWKVCQHPLISPVYADPSGFPPTLIQAGDAEMLRDETLMLAHKIASCNPKVAEAGFVRHELYRDMPHVFQAFLWLPSARCAIRNIANFIRSLDSPSYSGSHDGVMDMMCPDAHLAENRDVQEAFAIRKVSETNDHIVIDLDDLESLPPSPPLNNAVIEDTNNDRVEAAIKDVVSQMMGEYATSDASELKRKSSYANLKAAERQAEREKWAEKKRENGGEEESDEEVGDAGRAFFRVHSSLGLKSLALPLTPL
ncbi:hypothetical protein SmJEL517_g06118 [Synchytrium microbalum]|uniref:Alpha/beta hydrolase fold-3 domain-containing protein n=1 Tax=Synchytrium microbalum TaxID=1806994 RepID=A0A507BY77_9FUNG|nr:uncharacterized protein SmJEL517_g06118 [Synchytrium microbalum]TPX30295.1 hypothetical protein SmJEL517_g06118 [Synchytrium microbalum]